MFASGRSRGLPAERRKCASALVTSLQMALDRGAAASSAEAGASAAEAARAGHRLAGVVIMLPGAVIPREAMPTDILERGITS